MVAPPDRPQLDELMRRAPAGMTLAEKKRTAAFARHALERQPTATADDLYCGCWRGPRCDAIRRLGVVSCM